MSQISALLMSVAVKPSEASIVQYALIDVCSRAHGGKQL